MPFTCQLRTDSYSNAMSVSSARTFTGDNQLSISQAIAAGTTNQEILAAIDVSQLKMLVIQSDVNVTIKTNSSGAPADTLNIVGGIPYVWGDGDYNALLLTTDVSKLFVTVPGSAPANLQVLALVDLP